MIDETLTTLILSMSVLMVGILFLVGLYRFGISLFNRTHFLYWESLLELFAKYLASRTGISATQHLLDGYQKFLEKRNDFWEYYSQVALAVLIVVVLGVLLLTKTISAEAGLPILSAVAGFAIAKTNSSSSSPSIRPELPPSKDMQ